VPGLGLGWPSASTMLCWLRFLLAVAVYVMAAPQNVMHRPSLANERRAACSSRIEPVRYLLNQGLPGNGFGTKGPKMVCLDSRWVGRDGDRASCAVPFGQKKWASWEGTVVWHRGMQGARMLLGGWLMPEGTGGAAATLARRWDGWSMVWGATRRSWIHTRG
jgi:hypothetical protein